VQVCFGFFTGNGEPVYLEYFDAVFAIEADECLRIFLPIGKIILYAGIEPKTDFNT
jgi:hypothetical protein